MTVLFHLISYVFQIVVTHEDRTLITTSVDGFLCIWRIVCSEDKRLDLNRGFGHVTELLLCLSELEGMTGGLRELRDRLEEAEGEHEYAMRQVTASHESALKETNNNYTVIIEDLKFRNKVSSSKIVFVIWKMQELHNEGIYFQQN